MTSPLQMEADKETINPLKTMAAVFPVFHHPQLLYLPVNVVYSHFYLFKGTEFVW